MWIADHVLNSHRGNHHLLLQYPDSVKCSCAFIGMDTILPNYKPYIPRIGKVSPRHGSLLYTLI